MANAVAVLKAELSQAKKRVAALTTAISVLGGNPITAKSSTMSSARRNKISRAMKAAWKKRKAGKS
jgi:hypothetical protein